MLLPIGREADAYAVPLTAESPRTRRNRDASRLLQKTYDGMKDKIIAKQKS
jgi:hypothetical protein